MNSDKNLVEVFFSIGSNIDPEKNINFALDQLNKLFNHINCSSIYKTETVGFKGDYFLNLVAKAETFLTPNEINKNLKKIEKDSGRDFETARFSSRTLDIDMILYDQLIDESINVPRDEIDLYAFVIEPLAEINPEGIHPISGAKYYDLWEQFKKK